jgi:hypothetical protein
MEETMNADQTRLIYSSPNGDDWFLCCEGASGSVYVKHRANASSGGHETDLDIGDFLNRGPRNPEHEALLRLIGTLAHGGPLTEPKVTRRNRGSVTGKTSAG